MDTNLLSPKAHGIMDYALAATLLTAPKALGINNKAVRMYALLAAKLTTYNLLTDHPVGVKPAISMETHKKIDYANLGVLLMGFLSKRVRKDQRALAFHSAVTVMAVANVLLTDWEAGSK
jgi:hypothetical protein